MLQPYLHEQLIFINEDISSKEDLFKHVHTAALEAGYVTEQFGDKLAERESNFPTGLELEGVNVAIPHTDPEFVKEQFIAVYALKQPVNFSRMDDPSQETAVSVAFVLGLNQPHAQLEVLQDLMAKLQDQNFIKGITESQNKKQIIERF